MVGLVRAILNGFHVAVQRVSRKLSTAFCVYVFSSKGLHYSSLDVTIEFSCNSRLGLHVIGVSQIATSTENRLTTSPWKPTYVNTA